MPDMGRVGVVRGFHQWLVGCRRERASRGSQDRCEQVVSDACGLRGAMSKEMSELGILTKVVSEIRSKLLVKERQLASLRKEVKSLQEQNQAAIENLAKFVEGIDCVSTGNYGWRSRITTMLAQLWDAAKEDSCQERIQ